MGIATAPVVTLALLLSGCSTSEENARPDPVDLSQFGPGTERFTVIEALGKPEGTVVQNTQPCDIYRIYTRGLSSGGKAAMAAGETVTDIATLGLAEIIWTPVHAGTRPRIHTVLFCYGPDARLLDYWDKDPSRRDQAVHVVVDPAGYQKPIVLPAAPAAALPAAGDVGRPGANAPASASTPVSSPERPADETP